MHGGAESCMFAAREGRLQVLQWLREDGATWDSRVHLGARNSRKAFHQNIGHFHYFLSEMYNSKY